MFGCVKGIIITDLCFTKSLVLVETMRSSVLVVSGMSSDTRHSGVVISVLGSVVFGGSADVLAASGALLKSLKLSLLRIDETKL